MRLILALALCGVASAHVPGVYCVLDKGTRSKMPPKLEDAPLPPFAVYSPIPGTVVVLWHP